MVVLVGAESAETTDTERPSEAAEYMMRKWSSLENVVQHWANFDAPRMQETFRIGREIRVNWESLPSRYS
jgi:hypothetical protein